MLFNSHVFIWLFLPITLAVFFTIGGRGHHRIAISWLVGASLFFYGWWNPAYLGLIVVSMLFNYAVGITLSSDQQDSHFKKMALVIGVTINLGLLGYFKYANFFVDTVNAILDTGWQMKSIILPLAISFFTFQQIAYLVDAYRGETREYNFLHYCLFVTFFPQLIAGPIVHHKEMLPQFSNDRIYRLSQSNLAIGLTIFFIGLFKKVMLADNFAVHATPVFTAAELGEPLSFFEAWKGLFSYTFQLYFDFSGYSDMAIGLARLFGIKLPINFNSPYQAVNIIDFWRRWHITLSRFLRDYLYIALGGNRKGPARRYINLFTTMLLGGLWHGAGWTFVVWGALHGSYLIINHAWHKIWTRKIDTWWSRGIARLITLFAVMIGWLFFRAESFNGAMHMLKAMFNLPHALQSTLLPLEKILSHVGVGLTGGFVAEQHYIDFAWLIFWLFIVFIWPNTQQWLRNFEPALDDHVKEMPQPFELFWNRFAWRPNIYWAVAAGVIAWLTMLNLAKVSEFLYFQF